MFKSFLSKHSFSEYNFDTPILPTVNDREFWDNFQNETCVKEAEKELDYAWPIIKATDFMEFKKSGNRLIMENPHFDRREHLVLFTLAELKENQGRFLPQIVNGLFAICEETFWGLSAHLRNNGVDNIPYINDPHIDLFAAETAEHLATIAYMLRDPLLDFCPEILERVDYELERRIKSFYVFHRESLWMGYTCRTNNWNPWILSNLTTVFLLTESRGARFYRAIEKIFTESQHYYDSIPDDGSCDEGTSYWGHAGASFYQLLYQFKIATGGELDLFGDTKVKLIAEFMKKAHMVSNIFVNIGDCHAVGKSYLMPLLYGYAKATEQEELEKFSVFVYREGGKHPELLSHSVRTVRRIIYHSYLMREMDEYPVSQYKHNELEYLPDMQFAVLRQGELSLAVKGGFNDESHNHNDVGSFSLYDGKIPVLVDVGISTYTKFTFLKKYRYTTIPWTRSSYHNLPIINDVEQHYGAEYRADSFAVTQHSADISLADAYPDEAGLKSLRRHICIKDNRIECTDNFVFLDENKTCVTEILMSVLEARQEGNRVIIGDKYRISADKGELDVEFVSFNDDLLRSDWNTDGVYRIKFKVQGVQSITLVIEKLNERDS